MAASEPEGYFNTIDAFWPLVIQQPVGRQTDAQLARQFAADAARLQQHAQSGGRHIAIFDMTWMENPSPTQREQMAAFLEENLETLKEALVGTAFVVPNVFKRGIITAVFWMQRYPLPYGVVKDMDAALAWVLERSEAAQLGLPDPLRRIGVDAFRTQLHTV